MIYYPLHKYFVFNGVIKPNTEFISSENAGGIYEVLRVIDGIPLFFMEHIERFFNSALLAGKQIKYSKDDILNFLIRLIDSNEISCGNILLSCKSDLKAFFIPHKYPPEDWYSSGVSCGIFQAERSNPNVKIFQTHVRREADRIMENQGLYEVLLIDNLGRITEGSRSNVFFAEDDCLVTPPGHQVLRGITREKAIMLAKDEQIPFKEQDILLKDMSSFDAVFITGTSSKILPVAEIGGVKFNPLNRIVQLIRKKYDDLIKMQIDTTSNRAGL
jgi:branched-chain amino acid aminotransferase